MRLLPRLVLLLGLALPALGAEIGKPAPGFSDLPDERGAKHSLSQHKGQIVVLLVWGSRCPHSRRYAPRLRELAARYAPKRGAKGEELERAKVVVFGLAPNAYETPETLRAGREAGKLSFPILIDEKGALTQKLGAATTPTCFVIDAAGVLRYRGAIDDDPQGKKEHPVPHLRLAIDALLAGKAPPQTKTGGPGFRIQFSS
ncbi:MAG: redoxin domain-containing protein [Planctomycetota bacterium]